VSRRTTLLAAAFGVAAAVLVVPALTSAVTAGAVLDQSAAENACNADVGPGQSLSQTFTAGRNGSLNNGVDAPLHVSIVATSAGTPDGSTVLATADVVGSQVSNSWTDVDVAFSSPPASVAGIRYAIMLTSATTTDWLWDCASPQDYAGGQFYFNNGGVGSWTGLSVYDLVFSTYVLTPSAGRAGYCATAGDTWQDGTAIRPGTFLDLIAGQPESDTHYTGATLAIYVHGKGITCDPPPAGWTRQGRADSAGPSSDPTAPYAYFAP
jgi:hypothetical protein